MNEFKGTPGPWEWRKDSYAGSVYNERGFLMSGNVIPVNEDREEGESWLDMMRRTDGDREKARLESQANTVLIAAAPELLEALMELRDLVQDYLRGMYRPDSFTLQPADHAIAKALGETE